MIHSIMPDIYVLNKGVFFTKFLRKLNFLLVKGTYPMINDVTIKESCRMGFFSFFLLDCSADEEILLAIVDFLDRFMKIIKEKNQSSRR